MILSQVTLQVETTVKKPNGAEKNGITNITLPAVKQRISQSRLDEFSICLLYTSPSPRDCS